MKYGKKHPMNVEQTKAAPHPLPTSKPGVKMAMPKSSPKRVATGTYASDK